MYNLLVELKRTLLDTLFGVDYLSKNLLNVQLDLIMVTLLEFFYLLIITEKKKVFIYK